MSLSSLKLDFLEYLELERNVSQNTIENYNHYLVRFLDFVGDIKPSEINLELIKKIDAETVGDFKPDLIILLDVSEDEIWKVILWIYDGAGRQPRTWEAKHE